MENNFLVQYFLDRGLYNCTKSEYEQVIFYCLVKEKFPELNFYQCSAEEIYAIGETLNLDVQKVNKLLRGIPYIKGCQNIQKPEFIDVLCKNIDSLDFNHKKAEVSFVINNPLEKEIILKRFSEKNVVYDFSFNKNLLKISINHLFKNLMEQEKNTFSKKILGVLKSNEDEIPEEIKKNRITNNNYHSEPKLYRLAEFNMPFKILLTFPLLKDIIISYKVCKYREQYIRRRKPNDIYRICN